MTTTGRAQGGFLFPEIYLKKQEKSEQALRSGDLDYASFSKWSFSDEFLSFILQNKFLEFADQTYPNPRIKNEIPIWFLVATQFILRLHNKNSYSHLSYLLNSGSVLTKIGFNVKAPRTPGFNRKNKKERITAVNQDSIRKFYKDTNFHELRSWYNSDLQRWLKARKVFDDEGVFILDQTHLVVPDNPNYKGAVKMPVDEHGQRYKNYEKLTTEQKKALKYHPCYTLSSLLHLAPKESFHIAGYDFGPGNEDELAQADRIIPQFCKSYPGVMKELIEDRGYLSGKRISEYKKKYKVDTLMPLKSNMENFKDAFVIAEKKDKWTLTELEKNNEGKILRETHTTLVEKMNLWVECSVELNVYASKTKRWSQKKQKYEEYEWALAATKKYASEKAAIDRYGLRFSVEERFRQLKCSWNISNFPSPSEGLMESHICFILLTYSLLQLYLRRNDLRQLTQKTIETLQREEQLGKNVILIYTGSSFGVMNLEDYSVTLINMEDEPKQKLKKLMELQKESNSKKSFQKST